MKAWELLGATSAPDGTDIRLTRRVDEYVILANGKPLMSSRLHGSEEALATLGCTEAWLGTEADNEPARRLYLSAGGQAAPFVLYSFILGDAPAP
jgi:hypothetical protein